MSTALLYIIGCIGFVLVIIGGLGTVAMFVSDFEVSGMGFAPRKRFEVSEVGEYIRPALCLLAGIFLFGCGWPS